MPATDATPGDDSPSTAVTASGTVTVEHHDEAVVLRVTGALDLALAPKLGQIADRAARLRPGLLVLDLTGVDFLASAGMAVLLRTHRQRQEPTVVRVVAAGRVTLRPLEMTRLTDELAVYPALDAALVAR
jgi:anti-sigma B factor antagonist